jgi:hypothetical protein
MILAPFAWLTHDKTFQTAYEATRRATSEAHATLGTDGARGGAARSAQAAISVLVIAMFVRIYDGLQLCLCACYPRGLVGGTEYAPRIGVPTKKSVVVAAVDVAADDGYASAR